MLFVSRTLEHAENDLMFHAGRKLVTLDGMAAVLFSIET